VQDPDLADLLKGEERTRVRHDHGGHGDSLAAFSAAHSSSYSCPSVNTGNA